MAEVYDCSESSQLLSGTRMARQAIGRGELIVLPTDTVYGIAADAFTPDAVQRLLDAKGRGRQSPPPVLVANTAGLGALAAEVVAPVSALAEAFWPGALTIVLQANPGLSWDLGETGGTVALRIPDHTLALELLRETGPLAVSSANTTGDPAARTAAAAQEMLGDSVSVYLEHGETGGDGTASTIIDGTALTEDGGTLRILREGGVSREAIAQLLPEVTVLGVGEPDAAAPRARAATAERAESVEDDKAAEPAESDESAQPTPTAAQEPVSADPASGHAPQRDEIAPELAEQLRAARAKRDAAEDR